jgi:hypothetical protein
MMSNPHSSQISTVRNPFHVCNLCISNNFALKVVTVNNQCHVAKKLVTFGKWEEIISETIVSALCCRGIASEFLLSKFSKSLFLSIFVPIEYEGSANLCTSEGSRLRVSHSCIVNHQRPSFRLRTLNLVTTKIFWN